jgi:dTDP-4-dehydrorhamnose reductase
MKVAVIGSNGQLGSDVVAAFLKNGDDVFALTHSDIEVSSFDSVSRCLHALEPQFLVNTSAMHHVEKCEQEPERAFAVNGIGPRNLAIVGRELDAILLHLSTDYVFDGSKMSPYEERDSPRPLSVYGTTKVAGEYFVGTTAQKHFILRTSAIYGRSPCRAKGGLNFIELMLKLARERGEVRVVNCEYVTPTSTADLARQICLLSRSNAFGLYHATSEGSCSWYEFAREIFAYTNTKVELKVALPNEFPAKVPRPAYSVLENHELKARGLNIFGPWQDALHQYLDARAV